MKFFLLLLIAFTSTAALAFQDQKIGDKWAFYGDDFYATLNSKKNFTRTQFNRIFNENHQSTPGKLDGIGMCASGSKSCYRHISVGYEEARKIMFGELDKLTDDKGTYVLDVYCGKKFYYKVLSEVSQMHDKVNIEHTWPQSKFTGNFPKDMQKSDMHHLYLTDSQANSTRGNSPFGFVPREEDRSADGCRNSRQGLVESQVTYTPPAPHRGNVARALFYFSMHYNLGIDSAQEAKLRQWHKDDPIDAAEIKRHEGIARHQKVRNPFVDHPEIVDRIGDF